MHHCKGEGLMLALRMAKAGCAVMLALALLVSIEVARAQKPSTTALATAKELITIKGGNALNEVAAKLRAELLPRGAELVNDAASIYASRFSEQELKEALAFYKTPL